MLHLVKKVEHLEDYKLKLYFDNKKIQVVDLEGMLKTAKNMFVPLKNIDYFKMVKCDGTTICWPNGVDLCPDVLYQMGKPHQPAKRTLRTRKKRNTKNFY